jgi:hypothetical protein
MHLDRHRTPARRIKEDSSLSELTPSESPYYSGLVRWHEVARVPIRRSWSERHKGLESPHLKAKILEGEIESDFCVFRS